MEWAHFNVSSHGTCKHKMQHRMETRESDWERERVNIWMYYFPTLTNTCSTIQPPMRQYQQARATCAPTYSGEIPRNENTIFSAHSLHLLRSNGHEWAWNCKRMRRRQPAAHIRAIFQSRRTMFIYMLRNVPVFGKIITYFRLFYILCDDITLKTLGTSMLHAGSLLRTNTNCHSLPMRIL